MGGVQTARATLQASGPGSVLALPNLTSIAGSTAFNSDLYLQALAGGQLKLGGVTAVTAGSVNLQADGASSLLDLSSLASYQGYIANSGYNTSNIQASNSGTIRTPKLTTVDTANLSLDATGSIDTKQIASFTSSSVTVSGGAADFSGLTDATASSFTLSGGGTAKLDNLAKIDPPAFSSAGV